MPKETRPSTFSTFSNVKVAFNSYTGETSVGSISVEDDPQSGMSVGIAPGILFFPTSRVGLEAGLGNIVSFSNTTMTDADDSNNKTKYSDFRILDVSTLGFTFGCNYYFGR